MLEKHNNRYRTAADSDMTKDRKPHPKQSIAQGKKKLSNIQHSKTKQAMQMSLNEHVDVPRRVCDADDNNNNNVSLIIICSMLVCVCVCVCKV